MTAKEFVDKLDKEISFVLLGKQKILNTEQLRMHLIEFAELKCKEQREICAMQVSGWPNKIKLESEIEDDIINAKQPEL